MKTRDQGICARLFILLIGAFVVIGVGIGCGGAQSSTAETCETRYTRFMSQSNESLCDSGNINRFEIQVTQWREDCSQLAQGEKGTKLSSKIEQARECADKRRHVETLVKDCEEKLKLADEGTTCLGAACVKYWRYLKRVHAACNTPILEGRYNDRIGKLKLLFEERTTEVHRLKTYSQLIVTCDKYVEITSERQAKEAVKKVLHAVSDTPLIMEKPSSGTEVESYRNGALESCDHALTIAYEKIVQIVSKKLENKKIIKSRKRWRRHFKKVLTQRSRLVSVDGRALFPNAAKVLEQTIEKYGEPEDAVVEVVAENRGNTQGSYWPVATPEYSDEGDESDVVELSDDQVVLVEEMASSEQEPDVVEIHSDVVEIPDEAPVPVRAAPQAEPVQKPEKKPSVEKKLAKKKEPLKKAMLEEKPETSQERRDGKDAEKGAVKTHEQAGVTPSVVSTGRSKFTIVALDDDPYASSKAAVAAERRQLARDRNRLRNAKKRCKALKRKIKQCVVKIKLYTRKGNQAKTSAYGGKLEKTRGKLDALRQEIKQLLETTTVPLPEVNKTLKILQKDGCAPQ